MNCKVTHKNSFQIRNTQPGAHLETVSRHYAGVNTPQTALLWIAPFWRVTKMSTVLPGIIVSTAVPPFKCSNRQNKRCNVCLDRNKTNCAICSRLHPLRWRCFDTLGVKYTPTKLTNNPVCGNKHGLKWRRILPSVVWILLQNKNTRITSVKLWNF